MPYLAEKDDQCEKTVLKRHICIRYAAGAELRDMPAA